MSQWSGIGELAAAGTALFWTLSALAWTAAGRDMGTLGLAFLRMVVVCPLFMAYGWLVRGVWFPSDANAETWRLLTASGFIGFFFADLCYVKALLLIGPRLTLLLQSFSPPVTVFVSWLLLGDQLDIRSWLAMAITLAGVTWVVLERPDHGQHVSLRNLVFGIVLAVLAATGAAVGYVLSKMGIGDYDPVAATFIRALGGLTGFVMLITAARRWPAMLTAARQKRAMAIMMLGAIVGPFAGVALCMIAVRHCHAGIAATIIGTTPVLILPFVILFYKERVSLRAAGGALLSVAGVAMLFLK